MNTKHNSIVTVAVAVLSLTLLVACGKGGGSELTGTYKSKMGPGQSLSLKFLGNNELEATFNEGGRDESYRTEFVTSGDSIIMNIPESERQHDGPASLTFKRNGEALELTMEGMTMRFEKL